LPSSLTQVPSSTSVCSTGPPVSVCGTGTVPLASGFSRPPGPARSVGPKPASPSPLGQRPPGFPSATSLPASTPCMRTPGVPGGVPASLVTGYRGTGISTRWPSPTARALGLGPTHPQRISRAAEPSGIRRRGFSPLSRYSYRHSHSPPLHGPSPARFAADGDAPLPRTRRSGSFRGFGDRREPRWILGAAAHSTSELLRTL
jgi:hypothetical protein